MVSIKMFPKNVNFEIRLFSRLFPKKARNDEIENTDNHKILLMPIGGLKTSYNISANTTNVDKQREILV